MTAVSNPSRDNEADSDHLLGESNDETSVLRRSAFALIYWNFNVCQSWEFIRHHKRNSPLIESRPTAKPAMIRPISIIARLDNVLVNKMQESSVLKQHILVRSSLENTTNRANKGTNTNSLPSTKFIHNHSTKQGSEYSTSTEGRVNGPYDGRSRCCVEVVLEMLRGDDICHDTRVIAE